MAANKWFHKYALPRTLVNRSVRLRDMKPRKFNQQEWDKWGMFVSVGVRLVTKHQWRRYRQHRIRFIRFLDALRKKYGDLPNLLAMRADMMDRDSAKLPYLTRAYRGAATRHDRREMVLSAHSIAEINFARRRFDLATPWVKRLRHNLTYSRDRDWAKDCSEMEKQLRRMRTSRCSTTS